MNVCGHVYRTPIGGHCWLPVSLIYTLTRILNLKKPDTLVNMRHPRVTCT